MKNYGVRTSLRLIAIAGPKGSGKDTAGSVVCEDGHETPHYVRVAFADSLKRLCNLLFPIPDSAAWGERGSAWQSVRKTPFSIAAGFRFGPNPSAVRHLGSRFPAEPIR